VGYGPAHERRRHVDRYVLGHPHVGTGDMITRWCQGSGGYKGLTFYMWLVVPRATVDSGPAHWQGLVFPGNPPPH
jgi:hypothetical protein